MTVAMAPAEVQHHTTPRGLKPARAAGTQPVIRKERITEPILEHIALAVPGPQREAQAYPQERIVVDASMPLAVEKIDTVIDVPVPQVLEESGKSAVLQIQEQIVEVVKVILQERVLERNLEQIMAVLSLALDHVRQRVHERVVEQMVVLLVLDGDHHGSDAASATGAHPRTCRGANCGFPVPRNTETIMQAMQPVPRERIHELVVEQKAQIAEMIQDVLHKRIQELVVEQMVEVVQTISQERRERR